MYQYNFILSPAPMVRDSDPVRGDSGFPLVWNSGFPNKCACVCMRFLKIVCVFLMVELSGDCDHSTSSQGGLLVYPAQCTACSSTWGSPKEKCDVVTERQGN